MLSSSRYLDAFVVHVYFHCQGARLPHGATEKKQKGHSDMESNVGAMHDYIKLAIAVDMVDSHKGAHVFPRIPFGCQ